MDRHRNVVQERQFDGANGRIDETRSGTGGKTGTNKTTMIPDHTSWTLDKKKTQLPCNRVGIIFLLLVAGVLVPQSIFAAAFSSGLRSQTTQSISAVPNQTGWQSDHTHVPHAAIHAYSPPFSGAETREQESLSLFSSETFGSIRMTRVAQPASKKNAAVGFSSDPGTFLIRLHVLKL